MISSILNLSADGFPALRNTIAHSGMRMREYVVSKSAAITMTSGRRDCLTGRFDAWSHHDALIYSITQSKNSVSRTADIPNRGETSTECAHAEFITHQRAELIAASHTHLPGVGLLLT